jgi:hypothetical protein
MNELYVFAVPAAAAVALGGWSVRGWYDSRQTKAVLLKRVEEAIDALEALEKKNTTAQAAADAATLDGLQKRLSAL